MLTGWMGKWGLDGGFLLPIQLEPELGISEEEQQSSQQPEQIISAEYLVGYVLYHQVSLLSEAQSLTMQSSGIRTMPKLNFCSWLYEEGISRNT